MAFSLLLTEKAKPRAKGAGGKLTQSVARPEQDQCAGMTPVGVMSAWSKAGLIDLKK